MSSIKLNDFPLSPEQDQVYEIIPDKTRIVASTNRLFNKYPTRYISAVPRFAISAYSKPGDTVLDPFCGSGTSAIEAMLMGRNAYSIDIDPFARLLIKVKTTKYNKDDILLIENVINQLKNIIPVPAENLNVPEIPNIEKWFSKDAICWLANYKHYIDLLCENNANVKDYLYVVLAAIVRKVSNADEVSPKPYISTKYPKTPAKANEVFFKTEEMYRPAIVEFSQTTINFDNKSIILSSNDARVIDVENIDLAVTSPPYINAYDYVRSLRFEDIWLGLADVQTLRHNKKFYVGTEITQSFYKQYCFANASTILMPIVEEINKVDPKRAQMVLTYFEDMAVNMKSVFRALKKNGKYVIVVGDSKIRGQQIPTAKILSQIAKNIGYSFVLSFKYVIRDRYMHLPRGERGGIIDYDEILVIEKK